MEEVAFELGLRCHPRRKRQAKCRDLWRQHLQTLAGGEGWRVDWGVENVLDQDCD